jgi:hypothetical protein
MPRKANLLLIEIVMFIKSAARGEGMVAAPFDLDLAVKPQEVIPSQTESADRWLACEANMRPVPVVAMEPSGQRGISLL